MAEETKTLEDLKELIERPGAGEGGEGAEVLIWETTGGSGWPNS